MNTGENKDYIETLSKVPHELLVRYDKLFGQLNIELEEAGLNGYLDNLKKALTNNRVRQRAYGQLAGFMRTLNMRPELKAMWMEMQDIVKLIDEACEGKEPVVTGSILNELAVDELKMVTAESIDQALTGPPSDAELISAMMANDVAIATLEGPKEGYFEDLLSRRAERDSVYIRELIAECEQATPEILRSLAQCSGKKVLKKIAKNNVCPHDLMEILAEHLDPGIRAAVASNSNISQELLAKLSADNHWRVKIAVIENPRFPKDNMLNLLESGGLTKVAQMAIAEKTTLPEILTALSKSPILDVVLLVITNPSTPASILNDLKEDLRCGNLGWQRRGRFYISKALREAFNSRGLGRSDDETI